jgi:long-subunit fatty acid transport protein
MRLVSTTTKYKLLTSLLVLFSSFGLYAQENSPYSRYGLGDIIPNQSVVSRSMGGIAAGFVDYDRRYDFKTIYPKSQTVNFLNPASYSKNRLTSFDLGFEAGSRTLTQVNAIGKYKASSAIISYVQLGIPLNRKKNFGMNLGLRPINRINYKIQQDKREIFRSGLSDSIRTLFEGSGGAYEVFTGFGKGFKNLSIGFNVGYLFGTKDYTARKVFLNDSIFPYYKSNYETKSSFGGIFLDAGIQYTIDINKKTRLVLGAHGNMRQKLNGNEDLIRETFEITASGNQRVDSVFIVNGTKGKVEYPSTIGMGFTLETQDKWLFGADFSTTSWEKYSFFGVKDQLRNSWILKAGGQLSPNLLTAKNYWGRVAYRLGFNYGVDYVKLNNQDLKLFMATAGLGLPVRTNRFSNQYTHVNLAIEYGTRGSNKNVVRENLFRVALGFSLGDLWFVKRKYE